MNKFHWYKKYFEESSKFLWSDICRMTPKDAAARITDVVWSRMRLIKIMSDYESAGYWACQFSELTDVLIGTKSKSASKSEIDRFRDCARKQIEYKRMPENQSAIFSGEKWKLK